VRRRWFRTATPSAAAVTLHALTGIATLQVSVTPTARTLYAPRSPPWPTTAVRVRRRTPIGNSATSA
jgi:hypothetical protein